jgi:hypothetical protein
MCAELGVLEGLREPAVTAQWTLCVTTKAVAAVGASHDLTLLELGCDRFLRAINALPLSSRLCMTTGM